MSKRKTERAKPQPRRRTDYTGLMIAAVGVVLMIAAIKLFATP